MTTNPPTDPDLTGPTTAIRAELSRVDTKASVLLAVASVAGSVGLAVLDRGHLPAPAAATGWAATTALGLATALLALAVRPRLRLGRQPSGYRRYAHATPSQLRDEEPRTETPEQVIALARLVHTKYRLVRAAVDLLLVGLAATALTAILTL